MRIVTALFVVCCFSSGFGQTQQQWAQTVNWDGVSHWSKYINTQARYMGPNALAVPFTGNGDVDSNTYIGATGHLHFSRGDKTQNIALYGNYCLVKDVVSLDMAYIPVEFYRMNDSLKKERHVYYTHYYDNVARGDVILNANIRLLRKWEKTIQLALRIGYRYPAGSDLETARYTDGMGYYFDVSFGKPLSPNLKWIGMAGFYVWQLNGDGHRQNDAFLFGSGLEWNKKGWKFQGYGAGYLGYHFRGGDKPIVLRAQTEKRFKNTGLLLRLQQGVRDFKYSSVELGMKYFLKRKAPLVIK
ncbi:MAG: hypothetical protein ACT4OJ_01140 [Bacteroidota bacterium]